jgi:hypothetical protein
MALLFVLWIFARSLLYAALQSTVIWTLAGVLGQALSWILIWQILSVLHFIINFPRILRANDFKFFLPIDVGLFVLGLWQGFFLGSILTGLVGGLIWLTNRWTGYQPDWLVLWLGVTSAGVLFCRAQAKRRGRETWEGKPPPGAPEKKLSFGQQSPNLPQWQQEKLAAHRQKRAAEGAEPDRVIWTRTPKGEAVIEIGHYWANVILIDAKYTFTAYSKSSGAMSSAGFDYETERDAMTGAVEFMRDGIHPRTQV